MNTGLARLLQLSSPALPVGAYTYSQGMEWAVESGAVCNEATALSWIADSLSYAGARFEAVYLARMLDAWENRDTAVLMVLNADFVASRETAELRAETLQMGHSLSRLFSDMDAHAGLELTSFVSPSFPLAWSCVAVNWGVLGESAVLGYLWAWVENQVIAAIKTVPLGQTAGQRLLFELGGRLHKLVSSVLQTSVVNSHNYLPALAIASSCHETQYTRLFRS